MFTIYKKPVRICKPNVKEVNLPSFFVLLRTPTSRSTYLCRFYSVAKSYANYNISIDTFSNPYIPVCSLYVLGINSEIIVN